MEMCAKSALTEEIRAGYLTLAQQWRELADQVEAPSSVAPSAGPGVIAAIRHKPS
jgi:hypothetical protein